MEIKYSKIKVKEPKDASLSQIYYSGTEYSLLNKNNEMTINWAYCKDFLTDYFWASLHKVKQSIYGMSYDGEKHPNAFTGTRLILRNTKLTSEVFLAGTEKSVNLVNDYFKLTGKVPEIKIKNHFISTDKSLCLVINLPKYFLLAPPLLSLLTLMLRCGINYEENPLKYLEDIKDGKVKENLQSNDKNYITNSFPVIKHMAKERLKPLFTRKNFQDYWPKKVSINTIHNNTGIVSFSNWFQSNNKSFLDYIKGL